MNLSFLPGELRLLQDADGFFVVKMASQEILRTKSRRSALAKFNSLRAELEERFPARHVNLLQRKRPICLKEKLVTPCLDTTVLAAEKRRPRRVAHVLLGVKRAGTPSTKPRRV